MSTTTPHGLTTGMSGPLIPESRKWFHILMVFLILTAALNCIWLFQIVRGMPNVVTTPDYTIISEPNTWLLGTKLRIGIALVIAAICFYFNKGKGLLFSALALTWVLLEYAFWCYRSYSIGRSGEVKVGFVINLAHGGWWDAWVILLALVLLVYVVAVTLKAHWRSAAG